MTVAIGPFFRGLLLVILAFVPTMLVYMNHGAPRGGTLSAILVILMYVAVEEGRAVFAGGEIQGPGVRPVRGGGHRGHGGPAAYSAF